MSNRQPRVAKQNQTPECPSCGHAYSTQIDNGWANDSTLPLRLYTCPEECGTYLSVEIIVPGAKSIGEFDEHYRERRKLHSRKKQGYWGTKPRGGTILRSARILGRLFYTPATRYGYPKPETVTKKVTA